MIHLSNFQLPRSSIDKNLPFPSTNWRHRVWNDAFKLWQHLTLVMRTKLLLSTYQNVFRNYNLLTVERKSYYFLSLYICTELNYFAIRWLHSCWLIIIYPLKVWLNKSFFKWSRFVDTLYKTNQRWFKCYIMYMNLCVIRLYCYEFFFHNDTGFIRLP